MKNKSREVMQIVAKLRYIVRFCNILRETHVFSFLVSNFYKKMPVRTFANLDAFPPVVFQSAIRPRDQSMTMLKVRYSKCRKYSQVIVHGFAAAEARSS